MGIRQTLESMTIEEKIGQKIMLDFRYWDPAGKATLDMTQPDDTIKTLIMDHHIGGVILFANNLKDRDQIARLTSWYASLETSTGLRLFIATDNEGGNVFRLPRGEYASFSGNMALSAAIEGGADRQLAYEQGKQMAQDMKSLHINTNFAPVVDVNAHPANPVINVRAFSDDAATVADLAQRMVAGMRQEGLITTYKHFPGHGSTSVDSHTSLPRVDRPREQAFAIDLAPYKQAIDSQAAPDMVMTAHIQYPALDSSLIRTRKGEEIIVPATLSRQIQHNLLRGELEFRGVTITDALDMGAIVEHFSREEALAGVFKAGVDIALMPVSISAPDQAYRLAPLIRAIAGKVRSGELCEAEIDASVERILRLKQRYALICHRPRKRVQPHTAAQPAEKTIADGSITLLVNQQATLPLKDKTRRYFILTPWSEQAKGIAAVMTEKGYSHVVAAKESALVEAEIRQNIDQCDVFLLGTLSTRYTQVESNGVANKKPVTDKDDVYLSYLRYAASQGKTRVHLSLRAPYDVVNYAEFVDAAVASYSFYGYENGVWRGRSMTSLAEVLIGNRRPAGKLPVNTWKRYDSQTHTGVVAQPKGFGLSW
ncbi:glycoside hydrolase family 3 N-terminal domain-containing protein [Pseudomonas sp. MWU12-2037]|uniref:glycoside hydrolase family 3 N-terminal domain-containing protein n=1 Tax=Pseudomonas sp. MWU12-2037 TaxID=2928690 RepID=UPI0032C469AB